MFYISPSQIKTANASLAKRVWERVLWIYQDYESDAFILWNAFEQYICEWVDDLQRFCIWKNVYDPEKLANDYNALLHNGEWIVLPSWVLQKKIKWNLFGYNFVWYADLYTKDCIYDIKTTRFLTDEKKWYPNSRSGLSIYEEYKLQLWCYMKVSWVKRSRIIEVSKHRYKDWRKARKIFDFSLTNEFDLYMQNKYKPLIDKMNTLYNKYHSLWKDI